MNTDLEQIKAKGYTTITKEDILKFIKSTEMIKDGFKKLIEDQKSEVRFIIPGSNYILFYNNYINYIGTLCLVFRIHKNNDKYFQLKIIGKEGFSKRICHGVINKKGEVRNVGYKLDNQTNLLSKRINRIEIDLVKGFKNYIEKER